MAEFFESYVQEKTVGFGDVVADLIESVTFGMLKPSPGCGCDGRKEMLNRWWSWKASR